MIFRHVLFLRSTSKDSIKELVVANISSLSCLRKSDSVSQSSLYQISGERWISSPSISLGWQDCKLRNLSSGTLTKKWDTIVVGCSWLISVGRSSTCRIQNPCPLAFSSFSSFAAYFFCASLSLCSFSGSNWYWTFFCLGGIVAFVSFGLERYLSSSVVSSEWNVRSTGI